MSLRVKVWDLKLAVKYYSLYRGARYIDARYSESSLYLDYINKTFNKVEADYATDGEEAVDVTCNMEDLN